jgi:predicted small lipoprotein YifL
MIRAMMPPAVIRFALSLLATALLAACGQKGALYLPDKGAAPVAATPSAPDASGTQADRSNEPRKRIH